MIQCSYRVAKVSAQSSVEGVERHGVRRGEGRERGIERGRIATKADCKAKRASADAVWSAQSEERICGEVGMDSVLCYACGADGRELSELCTWLRRRGSEQTREDRRCTESFVQVKVVGRDGFWMPEQRRVSADSGMRVVCILYSYPGQCKERRHPAIWTRLARQRQSQGGQPSAVSRGKPATPCAQCLCLLYLILCFPPADTAISQTVCLHSLVLHRSKYSLRPCSDEKRPKLSAPSPPQGPPLNTTPYKTTKPH